MHYTGFGGAPGNRSPFTYFYVISGAIFYVIPQITTSGFALQRRQGVIQAMDDEINYTKMVEKALLDVVRGALRHAAENGLPGEQHFYITFKTRYPGVSVPAHLAERYKDEMTIVLQHQFWNVVVTSDYFTVDLSFNHKRETLKIPFEALTAFADPSVQFGLQFSTSPSEEEAASRDDGQEENGDKQPIGETAKEAEKQGEIITLDAFRKK